MIIFLFIICMSGSKLPANIDQLLAELVPKTPSRSFVSSSFGKEKTKFMVCLDAGKMHT